MKTLSTSLVVLSFLALSVQVLAADQDTKARTVTANKATSVKTDSSKAGASVKSTPTKPKKEFPEPPKLAPGEYAIFIDEAYQTFKTRKVEGLELDLSCLKGLKPQCQAYDASGSKPKNLTLKTESMNNLSAVHCEAVGGKNLIASDDKKNQYNFCRFKDGSMVNSWSMFYKHNPSSIITK